MYLAENYRYNIDPPSPTTGDPVAEFLLVSKEGYCVQFATALTLMMRRLGFPARYVEGYIANEFKAAKGDYPYSCTVTDKKAHAWTEVWLDGFGWMVYEATPGFSYRGQNIGNAGSTVPDTTQPPQTSTPLPHPDPTTGQGLLSRRRRLTERPTRRSPPTPAEVSRPGKTSAEF